MKRGWDLLEKRDRSLGNLLDMGLRLNLLGSWLVSGALLLTFVHQACNRGPIRATSTVSERG